MSKHTAGPWSNEEGDITGIENDPENGCVGKVDVAHVYMRVVAGRSEANARLIASAPDLLEAAMELKDVCNRPSAARTRAYAWRKLDKAIAKATGEKA
ncbi:hypothetical protein [Hydrogenophaga sp.]|uniref:hypothetical protein n=1 Tax=Hydrogenophaga sp. TaxID=1904254 RepID=UPI0035AEF2C3